ncbi:MAG TPA: aminotransferase class V-fold PLP-dependent enzyme [Acidimicrobiia bacterium]|jgi:selenocysteine lyase/cysteine desulfurase
MSIGQLHAGFTRFREAAPDRLHFAAHSHHPWPDVAHAGHQAAWDDALELADEKWVKVFGDVVPATQSAIARVLGLPDPSSIAFAPNTHELLVRLFSCLEPPVRILATGAEFHSFTRQTRRWEEAGLAVVTRVATDPLETFEERLVKAVAGGRHHLVYFSQTHFDSGYVTAGMQEVVRAVPSDDAIVVIDGYHGFMASPTDLGPMHDRVFYLAGGYKYAMAGEGACFMHCPPGYGARPVDSGWFAGFGQLEEGMGNDVWFGTDGSRFLGATFDPVGIYRMRAVLEWLESSGVTVADIHRHARDLQSHFVEGLSSAGLDELGELVPDSSFPDRGNFLTFRRPDAATFHRAMRELGVVTDYRRDRLRIGFGVYHDRSEVDALVERATAALALTAST